MLLDTCVVIDVLRGREDARAFVKCLGEPPAVSVVTATELVAGLRSAHERRDMEGVLQTYRCIDVGIEIATLAGDYVREYGPSHAVTPIDALIAATAEHSGLDLATLNLRHFPMFKGLTRPYRP